MDQPFFHPKYRRTRVILQMFLMSWRGGSPTTRPGGQPPIRYVVRAHAGGEDLGAATRLSYELARPLVHIAGRGRVFTDEVGSTSFFSSDNPDVAIQTVKRAQHGDGYVIRLHETGGRDADVVVRSPFLKGATASMADLIERPGGKLRVTDDEVRVRVPAQSLTTIMFFPAQPE